MTKVAPFHASNVLFHNKIKALCTSLKWKKQNETKTNQPNKKLGVCQKIMAIGKILNYPIILFWGCNLCKISVFLFIKKKNLGYYGFPTQIFHSFLVHLWWLQPLFPGSPCYLATRAVRHDLGKTIPTVQVRWDGTLGHLPYIPIALLRTIPHSVSAVKLGETEAQVWWVKAQRHTLRAVGTPVIGE